MSESVPRIANFMEEKLRFKNWARADVHDPIRGRQRSARKWIMSRFLFWCKITEALDSRNSVFSRSWLWPVERMANLHRLIVLIGIIALVVGQGEAISRAAEPARVASPASETASAADVARWI